METLSSKELMSQWEEWQQKRRADPYKYRLRSTGLKSLDDLLDGGIDLPSFVLYGGKQKMGKSTLLAHTAKCTGLMGDPFAFFSIEMSNYAMATRLVCDITGVEKGVVRRIEWTDPEWERLDKGAQIVSDFDAWWTYGVNTIKGIEEIVKKINTGRSEEEELHDIFVDYFQLMNHPGKKFRLDELSEISHSFKRMSGRLGIPLITWVAAQTNREAAKSGSVSANDFYGTGDLERDMDVGVIMHEVKDDDGNVRDDVKQLTVVGAREASVGTCTVRFNGKTSSIRDMNDTGNDITVDYWRKQARRLSGA